MVVPAEVQHAVDDGAHEIGASRRTDHDVAELARAGGGSALVDRKGEDVRRLVARAMLAVQLADPFLLDELDCEVALGYARGAQRRLGGAPQPRVTRPRDLDLGAQLRRARRSSGAWRSA
jgi:hypothetical protein